MITIFTVDIHHFNVCYLSLFRNLCLDPTVKKVSRCELEVDVIAEDILNQINVESKIYLSLCLHFTVYTSLMSLLCL